MWFIGKISMVALGSIGMLISSKKIIIELTVQNVLVLMIFGSVFAWGLIDILKKLKRTKRTK